MSMKRYVTLFVVLALAVIARTASAAANQGPGTVYPKIGYPTELTRRPITLSEGMGQLTAGFAVNLTTDLVGKPFSIPLAIGYGITSGIELDVFSNVGLCIAGQSNGCAKVFDDVGAELLISLARDTGYQLVAIGGVQAARLSDPSAMQAIAGLGGKLNVEFFSLVATATMNIGINNRDMGNKEFLALVLKPEFQLGPQFAFYGTTGFSGPLSNLSDFIAVPLGVGALYALSQSFDLGAEFTFTNLLGKNGGADFRVGKGYVNLRF
jgi:hypothetical protein